MFSFIMGVCNYFYACAMPTWITPMSRVHHGSVQLFLRMRNAYLDHSDVQIHHESVQLFLRMRNAYLDHAYVQDP